MPSRIQRRRTAGWRKPEGCVIVDRTSRFGNPFTVVAAIEARSYTESEARQYTVSAFKQWLAGSRAEWTSEEADRKRERILAGLPLLVGHDLACACAPRALCHADVLLEWATAPDLDERIAKARKHVDRQRAADGLDPMHSSGEAA
ncbi:DUF4326 domain-containing protein [Streptomyces showdoensis]|uniref:DUF4326 domain-containing protein n=1 Tax=Streptomyces showdoensis TaxID=68268 RepID=UPI000F4F397C|nr:DUF4326 domain-containing protein [Streptomyces showdoensis]